MPVERYESFLNQDDSISKNIMALADCRIRSFMLDLVRELMKATQATKEQNEIIQIILNVTEKFGGMNATQRGTKFTPGGREVPNPEGDFESASRNIFSPLYGKSPDEEKKD